MKRTIVFLCLAGLVVPVVPMAGCVVRARPARGAVIVRETCGPDHHWNGHKCKKNKKDKHYKD